jgi:hypothetical protein
VTTTSASQASASAKIAASSPAGTVIGAQPASGPASAFSATAPAIPLSAERAAERLAAASSAPQSLVTVGCIKVTTSTTAVVEVCGQESDPAWIKYANLGTAATALIVSVIAVFVAYRTVEFMRYQGRQARTDSVRDEYWLRTVVSPTSIQPFQAFIAELRTTLPGSTPPLVAPTEGELKTFAAVVVSKFNDFSMQFKSLSLIDKQLSASVESELQEIEDVFSGYVAALGNYISAGQPAPDRTDAVAKLTDGMVKLFKLIQDHQVHGGDK